MGKKIKKFLKKAAKAAIIGGAIYGATKLAKNRKKKALNAITAGDIARPKNYQIPDTDMGGSPPVVKKDTIPNWAKGAATNWASRSRSDHFKKGGLVKSGKPKLAKKGWK